MLIVVGALWHTYLLASSLNSFSQWFHTAPCKVFFHCLLFGVFSKSVWNKIEDNLKELYTKISDQICTTSVDVLWNMFKTTLLTAVNEHVPHRNASNRDRPPWITAKIKKMINARNHLYKKIQTKPSDSRKEKLKALKKCIKKATKQAYWKQS